MALLAISYPKLSGKDREWIQTLRRRYDSNYELIEPHFTLIFEVPGVSRDEFIKHVRSIGRHESIINFCLRRASAVEFIDDRRWFLFLVPDEGYSEIAGLHDCLYGGLLAKYLRHDIKYIPHITVGTFNEAKECKKVSDRLDQGGIKITGVISYIDIIALDEDRLETIERIKLG